MSDRPGVLISRYIFYNIFRQTTVHDQICWRILLHFYHDGIRSLRSLRWHLLLLLPVCKSLPPSLCRVHVLKNIAKFLLASTLRWNGANIFCFFGWYSPVHLPCIFRRVLLNSNKREGTLISETQKKLYFWGGLTKIKGVPKLKGPNIKRGPN